MAKIRLPPGCTWKQAADELKIIGVTLDGHQLSDGRYRAYVRKDKRNLFLTFLTQQTNQL